MILSNSASISGETVTGEGAASMSSTPKIHSDTPNQWTLTNL